MEEILVDPAIQANRSRIERHHLFPRGYLDKLKISDTRETNQIANYAYVEWLDNTKISDQSPMEYLPQLRQRFGQEELDRMYEYHSLPKEWEQMEYRAFLETRREMMAQIIRKGYQTLATGAEPEEPPQSDFDLTAVIAGGESEAVEFKSTLRINLHTGEPDKFPNEDNMSLHLVNVVKTRMGPGAMATIHVHFEDYDDCRVLVARCPRAPAPIFVKDGESERFYVRTGPSTTELKTSEIHSYIKYWFKQ